MKILIVSDTHRQNQNFFQVVEKVGPIDLVIHCGDAEGSEEILEKAAGCPLQVVQGNNDFLSRVPKEKEFQIGSYKVWLTHGHNYYVSMNYETIKHEARDRGVEIVMCGHTHKPVVDRMSDLTLVNPGSLSYPRQEGRRPSYIVMELDKAGEAHYTINYL